METSPLIIGEDKDNFYLSQDALKYLPLETQQELKKKIQVGSEVLAKADKDLENLARLGKAIPVLVSLRYIQYRLANTQFEVTTESMLEHEMLTSAFVVTYARLVNGGGGKGIARDKLPVHLRPIHDDLIDVRNKRYAHNGEHHSVSSDLAINFGGNGFHVQLSHRLGFHVGGANEWEELVVFLDAHIHERLKKQLDRLRQTTGYEWTFPNEGPNPPWADKDSSSA